MTTWIRYARLAQQLDDLRRDDERRAAGQAGRQQAAAAAVGALEARLGAQRQRLQGLAETLGQPYTPPPPAPPPGFTPVADPAHAMHLAHQLTDLADAQAAEAEQLAGRPALLPGISAPTRNLLVYAGCALVAVVAQYVLLAVSDKGHLGTFTLLGWLCAGFPVLAWIGGYVVISTWGRAHTPDDQKLVRNPRLGLAICFLVPVVALCAFEVVTSVL